jgi:hypothetical protein
MLQSCYNKNDTNEHNCSIEYFYFWGVAFNALAGTKGLVQPTIGKPKSSKNLWYGVMCVMKEIETCENFVENEL